MDAERRITLGHVRPPRARAPILPGKPVDRLVVDTLAGIDKPLGAYDIAERLQRDGCRIPMISLYRSLDRLCNAERVEKVATIAAFRIRDVPSALLVICIRCGATIPLPVPACYRALEVAATRTGFSIGKLALEAAGLCPDCSRPDEKE